MSINYREFIHPEDEAARQQLEAVPGFQTVTKYFMELGIEKFYHGLFMAEKIRLSPTQLPALYSLLPPICGKFGITEPEFYLEMSPEPNAYTMGDKQAFLVVTSGLLAHVRNDGELTAVLAHECGHILCRHVFYRTMASLMVHAVDSLGVIGNLIVPVELALNYWSRRSELSADRAELVYLGNSEPVVNVLVRLSGGPAEITGKLNIEEYMAQARYYQDIQNNKWHKILQSAAIMNRQHPFAAVRINEILKWEKSGQYRKLHSILHSDVSRRQCPHCLKEVDEHAKFCRFCGHKQ